MMRKYGKFLTKQQIKDLETFLKSIDILTEEDVRVIMRSKLLNNRIILEE